MIRVVSDVTRCEATYMLKAEGPKCFARSSLGPVANATDVLQP